MPELPPPPPHAVSAKDAVSAARRVIVEVFMAYSLWKTKEAKKVIQIIYRLCGTGCSMNKRSYPALPSDNPACSRKG